MTTSDTVFSGADESCLEFIGRQSAAWWSDWTMRIEYAGAIPSPKFVQKFVGRADAEILRNSGPTDPETAQMLRCMRYDLELIREHKKQRLSERESIDRRYKLLAEWFKNDEMMHGKCGRDS